MEHLPEAQIPLQQRGTIRDLKFLSLAVDDVEFLPEK